VSRFWSDMPELGVGWTQCSGERTTCGAARDSGHGEADRISNMSPTVPPVPDPNPTPAFFFMSTVQRLAIKYLDLTGKSPYETMTSKSVTTGLEVIHYFFLDGYHTTSEDAAEDHLRFMIRAARLLLPRRLPPPRYSIE
jgi:hypothetical protein